MIRRKDHRSLDYPAQIFFDSAKSSALSEGRLLAQRIRRRCRVDLLLPYLLARCGVAVAVIMAE